MRWATTPGLPDWRQVVELPVPGQAGPDTEPAARFGDNSHMQLDFFCHRPETERGRSAGAWLGAAIPFFCWIVRYSSNYRTQLHDRIPWHLVRTGYHGSLRRRPEKNTLHHHSPLPVIAYPNAQQHPSTHDRQARW